MQKERKDKHFIKKPIYEGGPKALRAFIGKNLKYPEKALKEKIEGSVSLTYTINYKGKVIDAKVISGLGGGCDEEAIRLVKLLKFEVPKNRGVKAKFHKNLTIHFRLPKQKVKPKESVPQFQGVQYNYVATPKKKEVKPEKKSGGGSYTITVNW